MKAFLNEVKRELSLLGLFSVLWRPNASKSLVNLQLLDELLFASMLFLFHHYCVGFEVRPIPFFRPPRQQV